MGEPTPLFAPTWFDDVPSYELRAEIERLYEIIRKMQERLDVLESTP